MAVRRITPYSFGSFKGCIPQCRKHCEERSYYNCDYKPIGSGQKPFANAAAAGFGFKGLYNGNIAAMGVNLPAVGEPLLYTYSYDQLNRLTAMFTFNGLSPATNSWNVVAIQDYREQISYDGNGNILTYKRSGDAARSNAGSTGMDDLTYSYKPGTNQLDRVADAAPDAAAGEYDKYNDIKQGQTAGNYQYDAIGNLTSDASEKITNITWTVYGKISSITKSDETNITYTYDASGNRISKTVTPTGGAAKTTWYVRDATGNVMAIYGVAGNDSLYQSEQHFYGSSRLGIFNRNINADGVPLQGISANLIGKYFVADFIRGNKNYELSNHLGNVLATVSDKKTRHSADGNTIDYYEAEVVSANDYYPFGMQMPDRRFSLDNSLYRYGFNGKELDKELSGTTTYDYGFRVYNPGIGRFLSVDPLSKKYPELTPYQFASNTPVWAKDLDGAEAWVVILNTYDERTTKIRMVFDKDLINPGGVYRIHNYFTTHTDGNTYLTSRSSGEALYSEFPQQFPNFSKGVRNQFSFTELIKSFNVTGKANILFAEVALEGKAAGGALGGSVGANGKLIGINFDAQDRSGVPLIGWNSVFRENQAQAEVGGGLSFGVGLEYRQKFDIHKSKFLPDNEIKYNGLLTSATVNTNSSEVKMSWGAGLKAALGFGVEFEGRLELNMSQLSKALVPLSVKFTEYEKRELNTVSSSQPREFNVDNYNEN